MSVPYWVFGLFSYDIEFKKPKFPTKFVVNSFITSLIPVPLCQFGRLSSSQWDQLFWIDFNFLFEIHQFRLRADECHSQQKIIHISSQCTFWHYRYFPFDFTCRIPFFLIFYIIQYPNWMHIEQAYWQRHLLNWFIFQKKLINFITKRPIELQSIEEISFAFNFWITFVLYTARDKMKCDSAAQ